MKNIAQWLEFPVSDIQKYFSGRVYGDYIEENFAYTRKFGVMITEESIKIINYLKLI